MDVFYPLCVHWHASMPCNCEGTEQLHYMFIFSLTNNNNYKRISMLSKLIERTQMWGYDIRKLMMYV